MYKLNIVITDDGTIDIKSDGVCHHIYLVGVLESLKQDILAAAANMSAAQQLEEDVKAPAGPPFARTCCDINDTYPGKHRDGCPGAEENDGDG